MAELWSHSEGVRPFVVRVFERKAGGVLQMAHWDASANKGKGNWVRKSLGHTSKTRAKREAVEQSAKLQQGTASDVAVSLESVFALYVKHRSPRKSRLQQVDDVRRVELWKAVLGPLSDPHAATLHQWETFIDERQSGAINARGMRVGIEKRMALEGVRAVEADCDWLRQVFNWAVKWRLPSGKYLMRENPVRGFESPKEKNPCRPVAKPSFVAAMKEAAKSHIMIIERDGKRETVPSYMPELLDIAEGTGRRISAICALHFSDLRLEKVTKITPYGGIVWPASEDKEGRTWNAPMSPTVRKAIDRLIKRHGRNGHIGGYLFPSPANAAKPIDRHLARRWWREVEELAGIPHEKGKGWHSFRRAWSNARKHLPDVDVAAAGGWKSVEALRQSYQQADEETVLAVVMATGTK